MQNWGKYELLSSTDALYDYIWGTRGKETIKVTKTFIVYLFLKPQEDGSKTHVLRELIFFSVTLTTPVSRFMTWGIDKTDMLESPTC